ncbi:ATP synthase F0 subunit A [Wolbachia pipientis]|nr:ATP synthase F0 subunit A [Wolbachia pipientis]NEV49094.1 ATP synthase F0 subunit A [Wolbachia pipientis]
MSLILFRFYEYFNIFIAHLIPLGTPFILIRFIVIVESIRILIRPLTLSIRLTANIISGHLLLSLLSNLIINLNIFILSLTITIQLILLILEISVSLIQAYVFSTLLTLYRSENNYDKNITSISSSNPKTLTYPYSSIYF